MWQKQRGAHKKACFCYFHFECGVAKLQRYQILYIYVTPYQYITFFFADLADFHYVVYRFFLFSLRSNFVVVFFVICGLQLYICISYIHLSDFRFT